MTGLEEGEKNAKDPNLRINWLELMIILLA
jgi:hypothetical protein